MTLKKKGKQQKKIKEQKSWLFGKISKIDKPLARMTTKNGISHKLLISGYHTYPADIEGQ